MTKIILHGCMGKLGCAIVSYASGEITAGIDEKGGSAGFPVYKSLGECTESADVIVDTSVVGALPGLLEYGLKHKIPLVICTTGFSDEQMKKIKETSESIAVLWSANMSLGVNLLINMVKKVSGMLYESGFDIEIIEKHHNLKLDAPSGTAKVLANAAKESVGQGTKFVYDRSKDLKKRERNEIGVHALRGGAIVGEHSVIYAGAGEVIELKHQALSKEVFAAGVLRAAQFLKGKPAGFYNMNDVLGEIFK